MTRFRSWILLNPGTSKSALYDLAVVLFSVDLALLAAFVLATFFVMPNPLVYQLVNLDAEASLGAWHSGTQLFLTGAVFAAAAYFRSIESVKPLFLSICALAFIFLSADEVTSIHEKITMIFKGVEYLPRFSGGHGIWIPVYLLIGVVFIVFSLKSWKELWQSRRHGLLIFLLGAGLFVFGAVVLEIFSYGELRELANRNYYAYEVLFEEAFELAGVTTMLIGTIRMCFKPDTHSLPE